MKQPLIGLHLLVVSTITIQLVTLFMCQVQGGIITNQQSLTLPKELADSIAEATNAASDADSSKNGTRSGRVMYTAPYSNVRIASKEPKSLKFFPIPAVISKKHVISPTVIVPVLKTSTTTTPTTPEPTTTASTSTTTSTTTTTTTTTTPAPSTSEIPIQAAMPDIIEILEMEEIEPSNEEGEVVTETISGGEADISPLNNEFEQTAVTEQNLDVEDEE